MSTLTTSEVLVRAAEAPSLADGLLPALWQAAGLFDSLPWDPDGNYPAARAAYEAAVAAVAAALGSPQLATHIDRLEVVAKWDRRRGRKARLAALARARQLA
jgi:hypothetical protein